jgi:hypothetical protein
MSELALVAAMIRDGRVANVGALSTDNDYQEWLDAAKSEYDDVLLVQKAGVGWNVTADGLRPDLPDDTSWVWDDELGSWERPVAPPANGGPYVWDEDAQGWVEV